MVGVCVPMTGVDLLPRGCILHDDHVRGGGYAKNTVDDNYHLDVLLLATGTLVLERLISIGKTTHASW